MVFSLSDLIRIRERILGADRAAKGIRLVEESVRHTVYSYHNWRPEPVVSWAEGCAHGRAVTLDA